MKHSPVHIVLTRLSCVVALLPLVAPDSANAQPAYADAVISVQLGTGPGHPDFDDPNDILGPPNFVGTGLGIGAYSLGVSGRVTARMSHAFAGDSTPATDLIIYEIGVAQGGTTESALVEVSTDSTTWFAAGTAPGGTSEIDLDTFGFGVDSALRFVRLTDSSMIIGQPAGVDIDAIVALNFAADSADFDSDGDVDGSDFLIWQRGFGTVAALHHQGDANYDEQVDSGDLAIWQDQFGTDLGILAVPEPHSLIALLTFTAGCVFTRRWIRSA